MPWVKSVVFVTPYLQIEDCSEAAIGIVGKLKCDKLECAIPKRIPICVSDLLSAQNCG